MQPERWPQFLLVLLACAWVAGCGEKQNPMVGVQRGGQGDAGTVTQGGGSGRIQAVKFVDPVRAVLAEPPITARGAKNETVHYALQIVGLPERRKTGALKLAPLQTSGGEIPLSNYTVYQVMPMPVETNHAAFVRYTGLSASAERLPRALIPVPIRADGTIDLATLRDPDHAADPNVHPHGPQASAILWVDVQVPPAALAGQYEARYELMDDRASVAIAGVKVQVDDFVIPDDRHLLMVGAMEWDDLARLWPEQFKELRPSLVSRRDERYAGAVKKLDDLVVLAEAHRCQAVVPALQPTVFWPAGKPPRVDWSDFDSVISPWMLGTAFGDQTPMGYWPFPSVERLELHATSDRMAWWSEAAAHFAQAGWITRATAEIARREQGRVGYGESVDLSTEAALLLEASAAIRVTVPLEEEQIQLANPNQLKWIQPATLDRLFYSGPGLVWAPPLAKLPAPAGGRWLRTDQPGLIPYVGAGADEREIRMWAWLAMVREARYIRWKSVLPRESSPAALAAPDELIWFYPGEWFGLDKPVATVQLKWLRRAEQDFEYLWIARQRGQGDRALVLSRLITKPVELQGAQAPDPIYGLMSATSDPEAWEQALELLSRVIELGKPGQSIDRDADQKLAFAISNWSRAQQKPLLMARSLEWSALQGSRVVDLSLGLDIYNIDPQTPDKNRVEWTSVPGEWKPPAQAVDVPHLAPFSVTRVPLRAQVNLDQLKFGVQKAARLTFVDGYTQAPYALDVMAPVAYSEKRGGGAPPVIDGNLKDDWSQEDALHDGPLVMMLSRPSFQKQSLIMTPTKSAIYSTWTPGSFYLAFKVEGADAPITNAGKSWVDYEFRRAWGEDVCEVLIQPVYHDNTSGPLFHAGCKKLQGVEIERRASSRQNISPWEPFNGGGIHYASTIDGPVWRGEIVIPWSALNAPGDGRQPRFLRFNFIQHHGTSGQSASWAGPIDFSRDEQMMGLIEIRQPARPGFVPGR
jgi:hypothetical protein